MRNRRNVARAVLAGAAALTLLISGCTRNGTADTPDESAPSTDAAQSEAPVRQDPPPQSEEAASGETDPEPTPAPDQTTPILGSHWSMDIPEQGDVRTGDSGQLIFSDLRVAEHEGFYRIVVEFAGPGEPGWFGSWQPRAVEQGRGAALPIDGTTFLDLNITGTAIPMSDTDYKEYYSGPPALSVGSLEVAADGTFEGQTHIVIGMDRQREIQIGRLTNPARVVIDVQQ